MPSVPVGLAAIKNRLNHPSPFLWLIEVRVPSTPATMIRITPNPKAISFGVNTAGDAIVYDPFPIGMGVMESDSEGGLPQFSVTVGGVTREIMALLIAYDFLVDQPMKLHLVHGDHLDDPQQRVTFPFVVNTVNGDEDAITFVLSSEDLYAFMIPSQRINRDFCGFTYKAVECGFFGDPGGTLGDCARHYAACELRGAWEIANGYVQQHPARFGGAPALAE